MNRISKQIRKLLGSNRTSRIRRTARLNLETLGERVLPSATTLNFSAPVTQVVAELPGGAKGIQSSGNSLDSMSGEAEIETLRLQMAMDRMSKMMETLSNMEHKISDTGSAIIGNFK